MTTHGGMKNILKILVGLMVLVGLSMLIGCNTMEGVGEDLEQAGGAIEDAAQS
jgi:predicted small secreted protein